MEALKYRVVHWRYSNDCYEDEELDDALQDITEAIAESKGIEVDEVTNEDFCEYVSDQVSSEENICEYNPETKQFTYSRTTELL